MEETLSVTEEMEDGLLWRLIFTQAQKEAFVYVRAFENQFHPAKGDVMLQYCSDVIKR